MIARLLIGPSDIRLEKIQNILKEAGLKNPHPDLLYFPTDSKLGIAESKKIKDFFSLKPYSAKGRGVILEEAGDLTDEAQNALLKTIEELPEATLFIMGADSDSKFLPTILSRCHLIRLQATVDSKQKDYREDIEKLLGSAIEERFEYIEKLKGRQEFLLSLTGYFHQKLPDYPEFTKELLLSEQWAKQNVNIRAILEYLMLVMPQKL